MATHRYGRTAGLVCLAVLAVAGCARRGDEQMRWARAALERNSGVEIVATDEQSRTFTIRQRDSGQLSVVRADQLIGAAANPLAVAPQTNTEAATTAVAPAGAAAASAPTAALAPATPPTPQQSAAAQAAVAEPSEVAAATAPEAHAAASQGRTLESGPGYSIQAGATAMAPVSARPRESAMTSAQVERRHEPIICQGARLLHIDNRNLDFDGDAISAQDGCEIHITNSHITATGVGVMARAANVHIDNSLIEGDAASIDASDGAQVYAASSRFKGLSRRLDTASVHDLGGNIWN
jgi:hypothetical protein